MSAKNNENSSYFVSYLKGFAMGIADSVPGISGGTIALILGVYERLITALSNLRPSNLLEIAKYLKKRRIKALNNYLKQIDAYFLLSLGLGIITAVITLLNLISYLLLEYPVLVYGFFYGLITISAFLILRNIELNQSKLIISGIAGFILSFTISGISTINSQTSMLMIFIAGLLAVSAKILPGISGSLILLMIGQYHYMVDALSQFTRTLYTSVRSFDALPVLESSTPVIIFLAGSLTGLFTIVHVVKKLLSKYRKTTLTFLLGMVIGSLRAPIEQARNETALQFQQILPEFLTAALIGTITIIIIDKTVGLQK